MMEEVLLDRYILDQLDAYDLDLSEHEWDSDVPVEELSPEALELL
jgi:hypothetical protein